MTGFIAALIGRAAVLSDTPEKWAELIGILKHYGLDTLGFDDFKYGRPRVLAMAGYASGNTGTDAPKPPKHVFWSIVRPTGNIFWLGVADDENAAWAIALGWPHDEDIIARKVEGWAARPVVVLANIE
jgi:hypothetical protein